MSPICAAVMRWRAFQERKKEPGFCSMCRSKPLRNWQRRCDGGVISDSSPRSSGSVRRRTAAHPHSFGTIWADRIPARRRDTPRGAIRVAGRAAMPSASRACRVLSALVLRVLVRSARHQRSQSRTRYDASSRCVQHRCAGAAAARTFVERNHPAQGRALRLLLCAHSLKLQLDTGCHGISPTANHL